MDKIYLASNSPRRKELLQQIGVDFIQLNNNFDETLLPDEDAQAYVERLALGKANSAKDSLEMLEFPILAADTIVVLEDEILGKPTDLADAAKMLAKLSGQKHQVMTSVVMLNAERVSQKTCISQVQFSELTQQQIQAYCQTQEPLGKAGSYAIQGIAASFVETMRGSYTGVVGLPLFETRQLLDGFRIKYLLSL
ncbi:MAG: septum formation inhibitor Maf [Gammaproteobacteria bacterium]|nr:septum formation inhibitor Maf [Gammaproteobacteria bacterium]